MARREPDSLRSEQHARQCPPAHLAHGHQAVQLLQLLRLVLADLQRGKEGSAGVVLME